jgi:enoyl-CoA hydratase/carnithine racemase
VTPPYETLTLEEDGALAILTLNRPANLNALNLQLHEELQAACNDLRHRTGLRVVMLTGAGRAFSAGADMKNLARPKSDGERLYTSQIGTRTLLAIESLDQITVAAVNGLAIGGGVVLASACDMVLAAESAWFSVPEVEYGLPLGWGGLPRLFAQLGPMRAMEVVVLCERFSVQDAERWGLVNHVYPDETFREQALEFCRKVASRAQLALILTKMHARELRRSTADSTFADGALLNLGYRGSEVTFSERARGIGSSRP